MLRWCPFKVYTNMLSAWYLYTIILTYNHFNKLVNLQIIQCHKKGPHLNTIERFHIHTEAMSNTHLNDDHTIFPTLIFDILSRSNRP